MDLWIGRIFIILLCYILNKGIVMGKWISSMLSDVNGDPSTKRIMYSIVVLFAIGWLTATLIVSHGVITPEWSSVFYALFGGVCGSYVGGVALGEKKTKE